MKKILALLTLFAFAASPAFASIQISENGTNQGQFKKLNFRDGVTIDDSGNVDFDAVLISGVAGAFTTLTSSGDTTLGDSAADVITVTGTVAGASPMAFEGTTADAYETTLAVTDATADRTVTVPDQTGTVHLGGAATALTAGASVTLTVAPGNRLYTDTITTDNQDQTITFSGAGSAGDQVRIIFVTDAAGSADEVITFHSTLCRSTGTLTLANAASSRYVVSFVSDGSKWNEVSRTAVQAA